MLERQAASAGTIVRRAVTSQWVEGGSNGFYFDTHPDRDNSTFDGLYKPNVAAYRRVDLAGSARGAMLRFVPAYGSR